MMTKAVPVKLDPQNLYAPDEFQEGLNLAVQGGMVYTVIRTGGSTQVQPLNGFYQEDL